MSLSQRKYLQIVITAIYMIYCGITTFCIHLHIVNGTTYVHHHPNTPSDHDGNLAEIILFSTQSSSIENITIEEFNILHCLEFIQEINTGQSQSTILQKRTSNYFLRPPPICVSHLG